MKNTVMREKFLIALVGAASCSVGPLARDGQRVIKGSRRENQVMCLCAAGGGLVRIPKSMEELIIGRSGFRC